MDVNFGVMMVVHGLKVVVFVLILGLLALVVDFREVMMTSPSDNIIQD